MTTPYFLEVSRERLEALYAADNDELLRMWRGTYKHLPAFTSCKDAIRCGARLENLSWRLLSRKSYTRYSKTQYQSSKYCSPLLVPLSEPELSTDDSGTSESGSETGHSGHESTDSNKYPSDDAENYTEGHRKADTATLDTYGWSQQQRTDPSCDTISASPPQDSTAGSTPRGTTTPLAFWSRSRANSRSTVRDFRCPTHESQDHKRTLSRSSLDSEQKQSSDISSLSEQPAEAKPADKLAHSASRFTKEGQTNTTAPSKEEQSNLEPKHYPLSRLPSVKITKEKQVPPISPTLAAFPARQLAPLLPSDDPPKLMRQRASATNLVRGRGRLKSSERLNHMRTGGRQSSRAAQASVLFNTTSTRTTDDSQKRKKDKIKFTTGDDASDDEDDKENEDAWSDDEAAEEEERCRLAEKEAEEKRLKEIAEEQERKEMFKKRPIRSVSLADLSMVNLPGLAPPRRVTLAANSEFPPVPRRGLLSSIFGSTTALHALQEETRNNSPDMIDITSSDTRKNRHERSQRVGRAINFAAVPSSASSLALNTSTPAVVRRTAPQNSICRSKSAIALPMLDTTLLNMSTMAHCDRSAKRQSVPSPTTKSSTGTEISEVPLSPHHSKSNTALLRLKGLATGRNSPAGMTRSVSHLDVAQLERADDDGLSLSVNRNPGDSMEQTKIPRALSDDPRPYSVSKRAERARAPPIPLPPQSPRTTRDNLLLDELSESLRQNLLWERQSRARMFGIGTTNDAGRRGSSNRVELESDEQSFHHKGW